MSELLDTLIEFALTFGVVLLVLIVAGAITFYSLKKSANDKRADPQDRHD